MQEYALQSHGLDISLFERLVGQKTIPVNQLLVQRRMRPEISEFIRPTLYPYLLDGEKVLEYPDVAGEIVNSFRVIGFSCAALYVVELSTLSLLRSAPKKWSPRSEQVAAIPAFAARPSLRAAIPVLSL